MKIYLSGKIGDLPESEYRPKFESAEKYFETLGHETISPLNLSHLHDKSWARYMMEDLEALIPCDAIAMLPGYETSPGANIELAFAKRMGKEIIHIQ